MKKILFLLLLTVSSYGQTLQNPTYGNTTTNTLKIKTPATVSTVNFLSTNEADGSVNKIAPISVNIPYTPGNYSAPTQTIGNHLLGIDTRLGQISSTSAGLTQRVWFTADNTTVTYGTFFASNPLGKGATATGSPSALVLGDNVKAYFNKDLISGAQPSATIGYAGTYSGNLTVSATPTPNNTQQRFTLEIYRCNNGGTPIASGVSGAPVGDLGVTVVAILDSGIVNLVAGSISNVSISGSLTQNITIDTGERLRYHVSAQKVGTGGGNVTFGVYYGSSYNSYYDVPVAVTTDAVVNKSSVVGITGTDALNTLNSLNVSETTGNFSNIQTLINSNPEGTTINLKPDAIYNQDNSLVLKEGNVLNMQGATLKRNAEQVTTTAVSCNELSTTITLNSVPTGWKTGDYLQLYTDNTYFQSSYKYEVIISSIAGNVITLSQPIGRPANGLTKTWNIGTNVRKVFSQITGVRSTDLFTNPINYVVKNGILDGNKSQNTGSYYWGVNMAIQSNGHSLIENVSFVDLPNECVFGTGFTLIKNTAKDLNGSFYHQSGDIGEGESILGGEVSGNTTSNTNIIDSQLVTGHSEGVITFSFTSGRSHIHNNRFITGAEAVLGAISGSYGGTDGANKDFIFANNYVEGFQKVVYYFSDDGAFVSQPDNIMINNNVFDNCGVDNWGTYAVNIGNMGQLKFLDNLLTNGTVITNIPEKMKSGYIPVGGTLNKIQKANSTGYLTDSSLTDNGIIVETSKPVFKAFVAQGSIASPAYDKVLSGGVTGTNESSIEFGNAFSDNNGTYIRLKVNSASGESTPVYPLYAYPDGKIGLPNLSGSGTRTVVADASGNLSAIDVVPASGTYTPTLTVVSNCSSVSAAISNYTRVGNIVNVSVRYSLTETTALNPVSFRIALPINRTTSSGLGFIGNGSTNSILTTVTLDNANNSTVLAKYTAGSSAGNVSGCVSFQYSVLD